MDSPKPLYPSTSSKLGALNMVDRWTPEDACTTSSPNEHKGTGEHNSFIYGISSKIYFKDVDSIQYCFLRFWIPLEAVYLNTTKTPKVSKDTQRHAKTCKEEQRRGKPQRRDKDTPTGQRHLNTHFNFALPCWICKKIQM